jgi:hypothetical protein
MTEREFLDGLKAGDAVVIAERGRHDLLTVVDRRDKVKIVARNRTWAVGVQSFSAKHGSELGRSRWGSPRLEAATPERVEAIRLAERVRRAQHRIQNAHLDSLPIETLEAAAELLTPAAPDKA